MIHHNNNDCDYYLFILFYKDFSFIILNLGKCIIIMAYFTAMHTEILPSLLAADFGNLAEESKRAEAAGADSLHLDIMDGHFVPNISFGPDVVRMAKKAINIPLNVHLMLSRPDLYIAAFADAGSDTIQIHAESECNVIEELKRIREFGIRAGITINPGTPPEMIFPVLGLVDEVLCMSVNPGYGGQSFMPNVLPKLTAIRQELRKQNITSVDIMVDGGINDKTAIECAKAGANMFVAGTWLFAADDMAARIIDMRNTTSQL